MKYLIVVILLCVLFLLIRKKSDVIVEPLMPNAVVTDIVDIDTHVQDIIEQVNLKNDKVKSLSYNATVHLDNMSFDAEIHYKKDKMFRMLAFGFFGTCLDIGSNDSIFWFWSKNFDSNTLYWARHEDFPKTKLQTPYGPLWMMQSLGYDKITGDKCGENDQYLKVFRDDVINNNRKVIKAVLIDKKELKVVGNYIYSTDGRLLVSSEWHENILHIYWKEMNQKLIIVLEKPINPTKEFNPPYKPHKVNMANM